MKKSKRKYREFQNVQRSSPKTPGKAGLNGGMYSWRRMKTEARKSMVAWWRIRKWVFVCIDRSEMITTLTKQLPTIPKTLAVVFITRRNTAEAISKSTSRAHPEVGIVRTDAELILLRHGLQNGTKYSPSPQDSLHCVNLSVYAPNLHRFLSFIPLHRRSNTNKILAVPYNYIQRLWRILPAITVRRGTYFRRCCLFGACHEHARTIELYYKFL